MLWRRSLSDWALARVWRCYSRPNVVKRSAMTSPIKPVMSPTVRAISLRVFAVRPANRWTTCAIRLGTSAPETRAHPAATSAATRFAPGPKSSRALFAQLMARGRAARAAHFLGLELATSNQWLAAQDLHHRFHRYF